jgi:hypothetical protein
LEDEAFDKRIQIPVEEPFEVVEVLVQPVVRHPGLREIVGPDLLAPLPRPDLGAPVLGDLGLLFPLGDIHEPGPEDPEGFLLVPVLGLLVLAGNDEAGRLVGDPDGGVIPVDVLPARTRGPEGIDLEVLRVELDVDLIGFGQDGDRGRGSMDATGSFRLGNALDPVDAAFVFQPGPDALASDAHHGLLDPSDRREARVQDFEFPALVLGEARVHPEEVLGEERGLIPASPGPDLKDDIFLVVRVLREEQGPELGFEGLLPLPEDVDLPLGHFPELGVGFGVGQEVPGLFDPLPDFLIFIEFADHRLELRPFLG